MQAGGRLRRRPWLTLTVAALVCASGVGVAVALSAGTSPHPAPVSLGHPASHPATGGTKGTAKPSTSTTGTTTSTIATTTTLPAASSWASGGDGLQPAVPPHAVPDQALNNLLAGQLGPGWIGGDSTYSTRLPDGREAFVFSDTVIGTAQPDGTPSITGMAHSSELVGVLPNLVPDYGGTYSAPLSSDPRCVQQRGNLGDLRNVHAGREPDDLRQRVHGSAWHLVPVLYGPFRYRRAVRAFAGPAEAQLGHVAAHGSEYRMGERRRVEWWLLVRVRSRPRPCASPRVRHEGCAGDRRPIIGRQRLGVLERSRSGSPASPTLRSSQPSMS